MKTSLLYSFLLLIIMSSCCEEDDASLEPECGSFVVIDAAEYKNVSHPLAIQSVAVDGSCLTTTFSFSGCDDDVSVKLVDEGTVSQTDPPGRNLKLLVSEAGDCLAAFSKTASFDLAPALTAGTPRLHFNLEGWEKKIDYPADDVAGKCDAILVEDSSLYKKKSHPIQIEKVAQEGDCLQLTFNFSGCSKEVDMKLVDAGIVAESNPVQRWIKLVVEDAGDCRAAFSETKNFDLSPLKTREDDAIIFHLEGWDERFRYDF